MRVSLAFLSFLVVPAAAAPQSSQFSFRRDLQPGARIHVANIIGNVRVEAGAGRTFEASAIKREGRHGDPDDVEIRTVDLADGVALCVVYPSQRAGWDEDRRERNREGRESDPCRRDNNWSDRRSRNDTEVDFTLKVPAGMRLRAGTVSGDVDAAQLSGELELRSVSGDVRLTGARGRVSRWKPSAAVSRCSRSVPGTWRATR